MAEKPESPKPKCPECGSGEVYYRRILQEFVCRRCGHAWNPALLDTIEEKIERKQKKVK